MGSPTVPELTTFFVCLSMRTTKKSCNSGFESVLVHSLTRCRWQKGSRVEIRDLKKKSVLDSFSRFWSCLLSSGMGLYHEKPENSKEPRIKNFIFFEKSSKSRQFLNLSSDSDAALREDFFALKIVLIGPNLPDFQTWFVLSVRTTGLRRPTAPGTWSPNAPEHAGSPWNANP